MTKKKLLNFIINSKERDSNPSLFLCLFPKATPVKLKKKKPDGGAEREETKEEKWKKRKITNFVNKVFNDELKGVIKDGMCNE